MLKQAAAAVQYLRINHHAADNVEEEDQEEDEEAEDEEDDEEEEEYLVYNGADGEKDGPGQSVKNLATRKAYSKIKGPGRNHI